MTERISFNQFATELIHSKEKVMSETDSTDWAIYTYSGNELKVGETGTGGLEELVDEFDENKILYAFAKVKEPVSNLYKYCGEGGYHVQIQARTLSDIDPEIILKRIKDAVGAKYVVQEKPKSQTNIPRPGANPNSLPSSYNPIVPSRPSTSSTPATASKTTNKREDWSEPEIETPTPRLPSRPVETSYSQPKQEILRPVNSLSQPVVKKEPSTVAPPQVLASPFPGIPSRPVIKSVSGKALYDYVADDETEINLFENEIIIDIKKVDDGWSEGVNSKGEKGLFPTSYIEEIEISAPISKKADTIPVPEIRPVLVSVNGIALYDYVAEESNEISFVEDEIIQDIVKLDEGWWEGVNSKGERGLFPSTYIKEIETQIPVTNKAQTFASEGQVGIALYDCEAGEPNELSFSEGEKITHIEFVSDEWWNGKNVKGQTGLFPSNYIDLK
ncbi:hypothetical protein HK096_004144 [Nowakowskiella sp. JEL0078]|nr:hypothetical protein HK096_004144 [Nowakowskiella sp. JEL0078]